MALETDAELLERFVTTGDGASFSALVSRHASMVHGVALRRTRDPAMAEEVTQTVFAILARKARTLRGGNPAAWLHRSALFEAGNARRKAERYQQALQRLSHHLTDMHPAAAPSPNDIREHLDEAMARLPEKARQLLVLRFYEQRSVPEICAETGSNPEACRKRIQRSIHQLNAMLRRRGAVSTLAVLTSTLAAQSLCVSPAAASQLAAVALRSAPALSKAALFTHTLHLMNTATLLKTSAAAILLAAIPVTLLWNQNAGLQKEVGRLRGTGHSLTPLSTAARPNSSPQTPAVAAAAAPKPAREAMEAAPAPAAPLTMEQTLKRVHDKAKQRANREFNRLCLNLPDLTDAQKQQLKEVLESNSQAAAEKMMEAFRTGAVARALQKPESLTAAERASLAALDYGKTASVTDRETLKAVLTPEQHETYVKSQEARRVGDAENAATDTLKWIDRSIDLSPDQKDRIFQQLAQHDLSPEAATRDTGGKPLPGLDAHAATRDRIIREILTPQQTASFDQLRSEQIRGIEGEMMQFYAIPAAARANP